MISGVKQWSAGHALKVPDFRGCMLIVLSFHHFVSFRSRTKFFHFASLVIAVVHLVSESLFAKNKDKLLCGRFHVASFPSIRTCQPESVVFIRSVC